MQLTLPDCCLAEFCPGIHVEGHNMREDGTYYSRDNTDTNAYHYHNTDGSVFYRYSDGSEYYRRKNGKITFRPPQDTPEDLEGADPTAAPTPTTMDRHWRPWYDWPPQLNLSVKTDGSSVIIRDAAGSIITFEPVGTGVGADPIPTRNDSSSLARVQFDRSLSQPSYGTTLGVEDWVRRQPLADIVSRGQD